jgi:hypothetical protein
MKFFNTLFSDDRPTDTFIRKGKIGGFKDEMSEEYAARFDAWYAEGKHLKQGFAM